MHAGCPEVSRRRVQLDFIEIKCLVWGLLEIHFPVCFVCIKIAWVSETALLTM